MAIPFSKYISITSGVDGGANVARKDLILRLYTTNELVPPATVLEFTTLAGVGLYFGTNSAEYARASFYFGYISKNIVKAQKISFYRYTPAATEAAIYGGTGTKNVGDFTALQNPQIDLEISGQTATLQPNFNGMTDLQSIANALQTVIQANAGDFATSTVTYDAVTKRFVLKTGSKGDIVIKASKRGDSELINVLEWAAPLAIVANGSEAQTLTACLDESVDISTNFASLVFIPELTTAEKVEVADWTQAQNNAFMYSVGVTLDNAAEVSEALFNKGGTIVTLVNDDFADLIPPTLCATTDYSKRNSVINYMFTQFDLTPSVTSSMLSNQMDVLKVNYYGQTQTAGQNLSFYQRGSMMGLATSPSAANVYANEIWLKDAMGSQIMSLLLSLARVSANNTGRSQILGTCQSVINEALNNGVISIGKSLNNTQKAYISQMTGDDLAYITIENIGYWIDAVIQERVVDGVTEYECNYTLLYSKDDAIRKVNGTHTLI